MECFRPQFVAFNRAQRLDLRSDIFNDDFPGVSMQHCRIRYTIKTYHLFQLHFPFLFLKRQRIPLHLTKILLESFFVPVVRNKHNLNPNLSLPNFLIKGLQPLCEQATRRRPMSPKVQHQKITLFDILSPNLNQVFRRLFNQNRPK